MKNNPLTFLNTRGRLTSSISKGLPRPQRRPRLALKGGFVFRAYWSDLPGYREVLGVPSSVDTGRASFYARKPKLSKSKEVSP